MNENVRDVSQLLVRRGELGAPPEGAQTSHPVVVGGAAEERGVRYELTKGRPLKTFQPLRNCLSLQNV